MIIVTGAAGFIGSNLVKKLNEEGYNDLILVDDFSATSESGKLANYKDLTYSALVERDSFIDWIDQNENQIQFIFHLGARTDTTEKSVEIFDRLNLEFSKDVWNKCVEYGIALVYASSAATYGDGSHGYSDSHDIVEKLVPLNPYGDSKNDFDKWALAQERKPYFWAGLKYFNVYGPGELHKNRMASVVLHTFRQVSDTGSMKLFRSHRPDYKDGMQSRDFVYVKDVCSVCDFLMHNRLSAESGLYNLGSGQARSFLDLATLTFGAMGLEPQISFIDTPEDIRDTYQYFTEADISKLRTNGYTSPFTSLEDGISDYVKTLLNLGS